MNTLSDTWTAFQVANTAGKVASVIESVGSEVAEEAVGETFTDSLFDRMSVSDLPEIGGWSEQISNVTQSIKPKPSNTNLVNWIK